MNPGSHRVRCAIYTRKSSEEGLEQDFNSLHAQRESCAAYVLSQAGEGWELLPGAYDDGGLSGGTLERPALKRLLADVAAGSIDIIVVYKVDRLTRSLLDFSKLVEAFDRAEVSFVSVTQSFNTTTSMGRLTLNMLLSFAQFEREVTAERIRDKIAASKAKGMWMGGTPPLGYRPDGRSLAIVEEHAAIVRDIYARYLKLGNVRLLAEQLHSEGIRSPARQRLSGTAFGGATFSRGQLYLILKNPIYVGLIPHKEQTFPGKHPAIIAQDQWDAVRRLLAEHVQGQRTLRQETRSLLADKIVGPAGEPLIATHSNKGKVRYRYYVTRDAHHGAQAGGMRIPAKEIEGLVTTRVAALFEDPLALAERAELEVRPGQIAAMMQRGAEFSASLKGSQRFTIAELVSQVRIAPGHIEIAVSTARVGELLELDPAGSASPTIVLTEHMHLTRTGMVVRLVDGTGKGAAPVLDQSVTAMLVKARAWWAVLAGGETNIKALAKAEGVTASWMSRIVRLAFLSPAVVAAVLDGTLRGDVGGAAFSRPGAVPERWDKQQSLYLPAAQSRGIARLATTEDSA
jgi:site-specific DNA recombinase